MHLTSSDRLFMGNCSCEVNCNEDNILALKEEEDQNETPPLIWKSLTPLLQNSQKSMSSGKSPSGYQWINGIIAAFFSFSEESVIIAAAQAFSSLQATIKSKRLELKDIILVHLYLKNMKDFSSINSAYVTTFKHCLPARVCVETMLPEEVLFSIDCLIHQSDIKIDDGLFHPKEILHVQNISHWAPASIGPYSLSSTRASHCCGLSFAEHRLQTRRLSGHDSRAQPLHGMWDPPGPGHKPVSPASAGGLSTTAPLRKPRANYF
ncbi:uncharacterized protein [Tursiops truncatus]|uniref:uncharacterized protein n=1 Tax=Tursiops truncatus TaxID=9739 RepID=UPI003CCF6564